MGNSGKNQELSSFLLVDYGLDQQQALYDYLLSDPLAVFSVACLVFVVAYAFASQI